MTREEAKLEVLNREPDFLTPAKQNVNGYKTYICPVCGNGSGSSGSGIARKIGGNGIPHRKCFKCELYEDNIGLWKLCKGITDDKEAFDSIYDYYGITVENGASTGGSGSMIENQNKPQNEQDTHSSIHTTVEREVYIADIIDANTVDFSKIVREAHENLLKNQKALDFLLARGLSMDIINRYELGYDEQGYNHFLEAYPTHQRKSRKSDLYRYIFPFVNSEERYTYFMAEIADRTQIDDYNPKYIKISKGESGIDAQLFNERYLKEAPPVIFLCEGIYDALSVEDVGGKAISLGGVGQNRLLGLCKKYKPDTTFVISLDNDEAGQKAIERVKEGLDFLNIPYVVKTAINGKDFNEFLQADREGLKKYIAEATEEAELAKNGLKEAEKQAYLKTSTANYIQSFVNGIADSVNTPYIPTGFNQLDHVLDGGLYEGLYIIGAISSLGKTTLITQITDQIARTGQDILIFSLEMARSEIMAKSISRETLLDVIENNGDIRNAKTTRGITTGSRWTKYNNEERALIQRSIEAYGEYAGNIYIHEGVGDIGITQIRETVKKHISFTGKKPVVLIDYLQILAPTDFRATDKQNTDKAVMELKRISRDYKIPVLGISSFNRANYKEAVTMEAFKESGAIEYSSDVLIGLQLKGAGSADFDANKAKSKNPREIELVILKNRNGATGSKIAMEYYPAFNYFQEQ